jgi:23S rRNA (guanosine2251-2'-O)-methyltransferase
VGSDAIKTSAGALNYLPVCRVKNLKETVKFLKDSGLQIVAATEKAVDEYTQIDYKGPLAIVMGSEEFGISAPVLQISDKLVKIPIIGNIKSLNVSVATGIILYESYKHRENLN